MAEVARASANLAAFTRTYWSTFGSRGIAEYVETLPEPEARWYRFLGERSDAELAAWEHTPVLAGYLEAAARIRLRVFSALAFAYLHVMYDFPRFLADSFRAFPDLSPERRYRAYALGSRSVWETIVRQSKRPSVAGIAGAAMRVLPGDRPLARMAAGWFLAHRCAAWPAAEALAAADDRAKLEARLRDGVDRAGRILLDRPPRRWMRELPLSWDLVLGVPSQVGRSLRPRDDLRRDTRES